VVLLIPYHPGNFIHGHAAKLWTNPFGSLMISDDHTFLTRVIISGPCRVHKHNYIKVNFPEAAAAVANQKGRTGKPSPEPEYWFIQDVAKLIIQNEPTSMNILYPGRETCSISAGGQTMHGKKPMIWIYSTKENRRDVKLILPVSVTEAGKYMSLRP
jgi:hypothetical protein